MKVPARRRAVSPIIATLLLIAISVAAGVLVYDFTMGLASSLTSGGNGHQITEQLTLEAYDFRTSTLTMYLQNTGPGNVTVPASSVYYDGSLVTGTITFASTSGSSCTVHATPKEVVCSPQGSFSVAFAPTPATTGVSYTAKLVTSDGGIFSFDVVAGQAD